MPLSTKLRPRLIFALVAVLALLVTPAATATLSAPGNPGPLDGTVVDALPVFSWDAVSGADKYEWEISADPGFNSLTGGVYFHVFTKNTRATLVKTVPNGTYYWHVRAVDVNGNPGDWTATQSLDMSWADSPGLEYPADGATLTYPNDVFRLSWDPVQGAWHYRVTVSTAPDLSSPLIQSDTQATTFTALSALQPNQTYYWNVTPLDPEDNMGSPSETRSFTWSWPSTTTTDRNDIATPDEVDDWEFSWAPVPGAAKYELEINPDVDFAVGSRVCCYDGFGNPQYILGTHFTPAVVLPNNLYYWRVRAVDPNGHPGDWNDGVQFTKTFDTVPPVVGTSIQDLRMRDNVGDPGTDLNTGTPEFDTNVPIVAWDAVPGASSYQVDVTPWTSGAFSPCDWSNGTSEHFVNETATTAWSPLGAGPSAGTWSGWGGVKPFPSSFPLATDGIKHVVATHSYCVRVRSVDKASSITGSTVFGDWTYLPGGTNDDETPAFTYDGPPTGGACSPSCNSGYLGTADYLEPQRGTTTGAMPLFTWNPVAGAQSYYVIVANDPNFTQIVDYAFTQLPAYAVRTGSQPRGYPDETTKFYWAVLPAGSLNGGNAKGDPLSAAASNFQKQSQPPDLLEPANGSTFNGPVTFHWTPVANVRSYHLQVATSNTFSSTSLQSGEDINTDSTEYTSNKPYPANTTLYWRVRADAANDAGTPRTVGLTWSAIGTFSVTLDTPVLDGDPTTPAIDPNPTIGTGVPTWSWQPVDRAISYDVEVHIPNGTNSTALDRTFSDVPTNAFTFGTMQGTGIWDWRVRANFDSNSLNPTQGPYTAWQHFTRTLPEPSGPTSSVSGNSVSFTWNPRPARLYHVQVSTRSDFSQLVENTTTDNTSYAPTLTQSPYLGGGIFYWRVAAADAISGNIGDYTAGQQITLSAATSGTALKRFRLSSTGYLVKNKLVTVVITVKNRATGLRVANATVAAYGAGVLTMTRLTNSTGHASFSIKPTRLGSVTFRVSKTGFQTAYLYKTVHSS